MVKSITNLKQFDRDQIPFSQIPNAVFADPSLSAKAKGILGYLLTKPTDWVVHGSDIANHMRDGIDAIQSGMRELEEAGYMRRGYTHDEMGRFVAWCHYSWRPRWAGEELEAADTGVTHTGFSSTGESPPTKKEVLRRKYKEGTTSFRSDSEDTPIPPAKAEATMAGEEEPMHFVLAKLLASYVGTRKPIPPTQVTSWAYDIELMIRKDDVEAGEIFDLLSWLYEADTKESRFWSTNIRSGSKLRDKFEEVSLKREWERQDLERRNEQAKQWGQRPDIRTQTVPWKEVDPNNPKNRPKTLPVWFWTEVMSNAIEDRAWTCADLASKSHMTLEQACEIGNRDPVTFEPL